jgi:hypothetical protein
MTKKDLLSWYTLQKIKTDNDKESIDSPNYITQELSRLNHLLMEATQKIHNDQMLQTK